MCVCVCGNRWNYFPNYYYYLFIKPWRLKDTERGEMAGSGECREAHLLNQSMEKPHKQQTKLKTNTSAEKNRNPLAMIWDRETYPRIHIYSGFGHVCMRTPKVGLYSIYCAITVYQLLIVDTFRSGWFKFP